MELGFLGLAVVAAGIVDVRLRVAAMGISLTRLELDAALIIEAAPRTQKLFKADQA